MLIHVQYKPNYSVLTLVVKIFKKNDKVDNQLQNYITKTVMTKLKCLQLWWQFPRSVAITVITTTIATTHLEDSTVTITTTITITTPLSPPIGM